MKRIIAILICIILLSNIFADARIKKSDKNVPVIFDTDIGNDIDDVLALQMLYNYEKIGKINIIGITISKSNQFTIPYIDGFNRFNRRPNIPIGYVYNGPNKDEGKYLRQTLEMIIDGKKVLTPSLSVKDSLPQAYLLMRKLISRQKDSSVVFIVVGPETNLRRLLESPADKYSKLNGVELVKKK